MKRLTLELSDDDAQSLELHRLRLGAKTAAEAMLLLMREQARMMGVIVGPEGHPVPDDSDD